MYNRTNFFSIKFSILLFGFVLLIQSCSFNNLYYYPNTKEVQSSGEGEDVYLEWSKKDTFHGIFFKTEDPIASVYFLHGNAGNLTGWKEMAKKIWRKGYNVFIIDYPGFGNSDKKPRHNRVIKSAQKGLDYFVQRKEVKPTKKILFGMSLGGNLAIKIGTDNQKKLDAMVLEGAFSSHRKVGLTRVAKILRPIAFFGVRNTIKGEKLIRKWKKPLLVVHSEEDKVCHYGMGKEIYKNASTKEKELWTIDGKHLRGFARYSDTYFEKIRKLVNN